MVSGTKAKSYFPEGEFQYNFTANRTFSRQGRRLSAASSKSVRVRSRPSTRGSGLSPEDVIALAQSPESDLIRQSFGTSLLLLQNGRRKVRPGQFVDLRRISQEPPSPPAPRQSDLLHTPRLAKHLVRQISAKEMRKQASTQTSFGERSKLEVANTWNEVQAPTRTREAYSYDSDRCVRCSEFPDIQIEGRSLSRILTNPNTVMAREYCEILGPESCPDCTRTRSQRSHQRHCIETSPAAATDVYKLALVHERAPHLSMREVQRKVYDGEIRDSVGALLRNEDAPPVVETKTKFEATNEPEISVTINKRRSRESKSSKTFGKPGTASTFEPIPETAETSSDSDPDEEIRAIEFSPETSDEELLRVEYKKIDLEKPHKVKMFPGKEDGALQSRGESRPSSTQSPITNERPVERPPYTKRIAEPNLPLVTQNTDIKNVEYAKQHATNRRAFTTHVVPSPYFFFDIADLADRLRKNEITERAMRRRQRETEEEFLRALREAAATTASPPPSEQAPDSSSVDSFEHARSMDMTYEPPVLYENKGRYLGVKAPQAGHRASASR